MQSVQGSSYPKTCETQNLGPDPSTWSNSDPFQTGELISRDRMLLKKKRLEDARSRLCVTITNHRQKRLASRDLENPITQYSSIISSQYVCTDNAALCWKKNLISERAKFEAIFRTYQTNWTHSCLIGNSDLEYFIVRYYRSRLSLTMVRSPKFVQVVAAPNFGTVLRCSRYTLVASMYDHRITMHRKTQHFFQFPKPITMALCSTHCVVRCVHWKTIR